MEEEMVEVFKTSVNDSQTAMIVIEKLQNAFPDYECNFDLQDIDRILRVEVHLEDVEATAIIKLLNNMELECEILADEVLTDSFCNV